MRLITSPWTDTFELFARTINQHALIVSPFISEDPLRRLTSIIHKDSPVKIEILTNLAVDSLTQGSTDVGAISTFCRAIPETKVWHLPGLHAKVYIADAKLAVVTSANLTRAGLVNNYEYGIEITESTVVTEISEDLRAYSKLGSEVTLLELDQLTEISQSLREQHNQVLRSTRRALRVEFENRIENARETLRALRAKPGESTNAIFSRTILYLLRNGSLSTQQLHPLVQQTHPDLCDDSIDRVIGGVRFGKRWKHMVRNAQQGLKAQGLVKFEEGKWYLVP